jgi:hypothetical protein
MRARIYQPAKTAMQSGTAKTHQWVLEFAPASAREVDPLMGWTSSSDTQSRSACASKPARRPRPMPPRRGWSLTWSNRSRARP